MEEKFQGKSPFDYFDEVCWENVEKTYQYYLTREHDDEDFKKLFVPPVSAPMSTPSPPNKLLSCLSAIDLDFKAGVFKKLDNTMVDAEDIINQSTSSLPSVQLAGKLAWVSVGQVIEFQLWASKLVRF